MSPTQILFILTAAVTLGSALMVVTVRNLVHAALYLVLSLFGIAVIYVLLNAGFLAVVQVVVYIGAIAILMIFAIMLTRRVTDEKRRQITSNWGWALALSVILMVGLAWMLSLWPGFNFPAQVIAPGRNTVMELGLALVSTNAFVLPFELASVLLLAALIGAIVIAWEGKKGGQQ
jgi:NADH-quinone oxidoreductase subunit J